MSHIFSSWLVVPVFPIQSALARVGFKEVRLDLKVVVTREDRTSRSNPCIIVAVAFE
ncbi:Uncharacterised protein [Streptococcus pneumoniae]|nr:Uncharacterised protein [Streptococcus pneumoniae]CIW02250.1 Uncharacterised protein [Streptococcus pneumoniae]